MRVLIACEFSGIVREAFKAKGHDAWSCDLLPTELPGKHIQADVLSLDLDYNHWDMMVAFPPCTFLCRTGVRWLYEREGRWDNMKKGAMVFRRLLEASIPMIAIENPIPHRYAVEIIGRKYDQIIQPYQFGHGEQKATCLWLKGLPALFPTKMVDGREQKSWKCAPGTDRWKRRSITYQGIADAMAEQWGGIAETRIGMDGGNRNSLIF